MPSEALIQTPLLSAEMPYPHYLYQLSIRIKFLNNHKESIES